jgi:hypothetical protein
MQEDAVWMNGPPTWTYLSLALQPGPSNCRAFSDPFILARCGCRYSCCTICRDGD